MKKYLLADLVEAPISGEWGTEPTNENGVKVIRTTNFTNEGRLDLSNVVIRDIEAKKIEKKKLQYGDIIIEKSGGSPTQPVGRVVFFDVADEVYLCNNFTAVLRPKEGVYPKYLFYIMYGLHLTKATLAFQNKTTGIINLKLNNYLGKVEIPLPPLEEQKLIAQVLDKADRLHQKDRQLLNYYEQLLQSIFFDMFGDYKDLVSISDITTKVTDGVHAKPIYTESGVPFISVKDITTKKLLFKNNKFISEQDHIKYSKRCNPEYLDILYTKVGATYGRAALVDTKADFSLYVSVALLKPNKLLVNPYYFRTVLNTDYVKRQADKSIKGIGVPDLHLIEIKKFKIPLPPIEEQEEFAAIVSKIEKQMEAVQANIQKSEALFQSLLQKAFKGELVLKEVELLEKV